MLKEIFDHHDLILKTHVSLKEDSDYYYLYIGGRDMQFSKATGSLVGAGSLLINVPHCRYCMECQAE